MTEEKYVTYRHLKKGQEISGAKEWIIAAYAVRRKKNAECNAILWTAMSLQRTVPIM